MRRVVLLSGVLLAACASTAEAGAPESCLPASLKAALKNVRQHFGPIKVVATRAPRANRSYHPSCRAVDFHPARGKYRAVVAYLNKNHRGGFITYGGRLTHLHIDDGPYGRWHKVADPRWHGPSMEIRIAAAERRRQREVEKRKQVAPIVVDFDQLPYEPNDPEEQKRLWALADQLSLTVSPPSPPQPLGFAPAPAKPEPVGLGTLVKQFLIATATLGGTMKRQGPDLAIGRLHPEFQSRLTAAIKEARLEGINAGIYSAYRPPGMRVGVFRDKYLSLHSYGLAADMIGIGRPGSKTAQRWHQIAVKNGIHCPYGYRHRREWNHCQLVAIRAVPRRSALRSTITHKGPVSNERMWTAAKPMIDAVKPRVIVLASSKRRVRVARR